MQEIIKYTFSGFVIIAIISVIVSKKSTTPSAIQSLGVALSSILGSIVAPISSGQAAQAQNATSNPITNIINSPAIGTIQSSPTGH